MSRYSLKMVTALLLTSSLFACRKSRETSDEQALRTLTGTWQRYNLNMINGRVSLQDTVSFSSNGQYTASGQTYRYFLSDGFICYYLNYTAVARLKYTIVNEDSVYLDEEWSLDSRYQLKRIRK